MEIPCNHLITEIFFLNFKTCSRFCVYIAFHHVWYTYSCFADCYHFK